MTTDNTKPAERWRCEYCLCHTYAEVACSELIRCISCKRTFPSPTTDKPAEDRVELVEVTQADREAAAEFIIAPAIKTMIVAGEYDGHPFVQRLAAHRRAAIAAIQTDPPKPASDLIERLKRRWPRLQLAGARREAELINPDGPEAAARLKELEEEIERLRKALKKANAQFEEYERKFYLESDRAETAEAKLASLSREQ